MAIGNRRAGRISFKVDGTLYEAKGTFSYNLGLDIREAIIGADGVHGYKETPQVSYIEGAVTDREDLDLEALVGADECTVTLELNNGKVVTLSNAWFASEGSGSTDEGEIAMRFESRREAVESN